MDITTEALQPYVGGQLEIRNSNEGYIHRGEVERVWVEDEILRVRFKWVAKPDENFQWHAHDDLDYAVSLMITSFSEIGLGQIHFVVMYVGEHATLFPPDGSRLDPSKVIGLQSVG